MGLRTHNLPSVRHKKRLCWSRSIEVSRYQKAKGTSFVSWSPKKTTWTKSFKWYFCRRKGLRIHTLLSERLKKRFCRSRLIVVSRCRKDMHFLNPEVPKKRLERFSLSDFLSRRVALRTHNLSSGRLQKRLTWSRWIDVPRCRKAMRNIFVSWASKKAIWAFRLSDILSRRIALWTHKLSSVSLNKRLLWSRWSNVSRRRKAILTHFLQPGHKKTTWA
jgi:hypothetical protein